MLKRLQNNSKKMQEVILYGLVGLTTTLLNVGIYHVLLLIGINYAFANFIALILCKVYAYAANKLLVFKSHCATIKDLMLELLRFVLARGFTGIVDYFGLIICVEFFNTDKILTKYIIQIIVIVLNYFASKFIIFGKEKMDNLKN